VIRPW